MPETVNAALVIVVFLIPGFIAARVLALAFPRDEPGEGQQVLEAIALSCLNYGVSSGLVLLAWKEGWLINAYAVAITALLVLLVLPIGLALGLIRLSDSEGVRKIRERLGITHPLPKAWDYFFRRGTPCWAVLTLTDGRVIAGLYGPHSFASSYPASEDIYLEKLCKLSPEGKMTGLADRSLGAIIRADQVKVLEFFELS